MKQKIIISLVTMLTVLSLTFGNIGVIPVSAATVTVFSDNFESGYANWSMSGLWNTESQADNCGLLRAPFPSPSNAAYYGQNATCTYDNGATNTGSLTMATSVSLPATGTAQLSFYSYEQTEKLAPYDARYVEISTNGGGSWTTLGQLTTENVWYRPSFNLTTYMGQNILIRFRFDTVDGNYNNFFGWMVDNVSITADIPDITPPTLTSFTYQTPSTSPTSADILVFRATFSEDVQNVNAADFTVNSTTTATITGVGTVDAKTYDITVSGGNLASFIGAVGLDLAAGQNIQDLAGNALPAGEPATDETYLLDNAAPTVTITSSAINPTNTSPIPVTITFSESVTGFTLGETIIGNGTASNFGGSGTTYTADITPTTNGLVTVDVAANVAQDGAGNNNTAAVQFSIAFDNTNLAVTVNQAAGQTDPTNTSPINFTAVFNKTINIATFTAADVTLGGTTPGILTAVITEIAPNNGTVFNIAVSGMTGNGTVTSSIGANAVQDTAGNNNNASTSLDNTVTYNTTNPSVVSTDLVASYTGTGAGSFVVFFNKAVDDPAGNTGIDDVTNPANYLMINKGTNGVANTVSCAGGVVADDTQVTVTSVSYNNVTFKATVTLAGPLSVGSYRLFICGTTSIVDLAGNPLNGGTDYTFDFVVQAAHSATRVPDTGFPQNKVTSLPIQPLNLAYISYSDLWLEIPKLSMKTSIVGVPSTKDGWDVTWLNRNAGWLNGSAYPTWSGNSVITAHVWDALNKPGPFARLKELIYGDQVKIHAFGQVYTYEIRETTTISPKDTTAMLKHQDKAWVTLITCEGYQELTQDYSSRRMVRAVLVSVTVEK